jgi:hypothetical protein
MSVHVDQISTEVIAETEPAPQAAVTMGWQEVDMVQQALACARRDRLRTAAEGFDD